MSNPPIFMGKLPIKGTFPTILKGNDFKWWGQNTDRKNYVGFTYSIPIIIYSVDQNPCISMNCSKSETKCFMKDSNTDCIETGFLFTWGTWFFETLL